MPDQSLVLRTDNDPVLTPRRREEIVRRYWMKGDLTPLTVANALAARLEPLPFTSP